MFILNKRMLFFFKLQIKYMKIYNSKLILFNKKTWFRNKGMQYLVKVNRIFEIMLFFMLLFSKVEHCFDHKKMEKLIF